MNKLSDIEPIFAKRCLHGNLPSQVAKIVIGKPREEGADWCCPYFIFGIGLRRVRRAYGRDGVQALLMALEAIRVTLDSNKIKWTWDGGSEEGDFGLPVTIPAYYGEAFARRVNQLVDKEINDFAHNARS